ncbi:terminase small subunit [Paenibacillus pabuli]|uniref:terminase small subunit n=1 Tax=Paenibacillus pabuli TaxID=1472 RepID=UPI001FFF0708|nr:terminase small subunit [Paenibacillus pabuli]UPK42474.1 terminase small subunit [Paenibacillus pabuli]
MAELRPQMMLFVTEYLSNGNNATQAAIAAGYSEKTASSQGSRLLKSVEVQQYLNKTEQNLNKDLRMMFAEDAVKAYNVMMEIMQSPNAMDKDRLVAARDLLDRAGYKPVDRVQADVQGEVNHNHEYHIEQQITTDPESAELLKQLWRRQHASTPE